MTENLKTQLGRRQKYAYELSRYTKNPGIQGSLTVFLSIALVILFLVFAIQPTLVKIAELQKQIAESEKVLTQLTSKANTLSQIAAQWDQISAKLPYLQTAIPYGPDYRTFNKELAIVAQKNGVELVNINAGEALIYAQLIDPYAVDRKMGVVPISFTLRAGGDYNSLMSFLKEIVTIDRVIKIDGIIFAPETQTTVNAKYPLSMNINGTVFYMADTKQLGTIIDVVGKDKK